MKKSAYLFLAIVTLLFMVLVVIPETVRWWAFRSFVASEDIPRPTAVDTLARLDPLLRESSGLALSRSHPGLFWTHNDSGDGPRFYLFDDRGVPRRTFEVAGARAVDWEDMDAGPCPGAEGTCLYLADFGDNGRARSVLTIYVVREPAPEAPDTVPMLGRVQYRYPDEPHDAELLAVTSTGDMVVVTKGRTGQIELYELSAARLNDAVAADTVITLAPGRVLPIVPNPGLERMVSGGSFRPDDRELAVRTYAEIYFLPWPLRAPGQEIGRRCLLGRVDDGGEALAWADDSTVVLTSETLRASVGTLTRVVCP